MKKPILVFTPVNPLRPGVDRLKKIHAFNVLSQNEGALFDYVERECVLPSTEQKSGLYRGQNVIREFNEVYKEFRNDYTYICKWDDDILLPPNILQRCLQAFKDDSSVVGTGLFQEDYGAPNALMVNVRDEGWYGAFSRFYVYRMDRWGEIPVILGSSSGDPDNTYQVGLTGKKVILETWSVHLDHRACKGNNDLYNVILDLASMMLMRG